jgi:ribosomal 50S subunit-associated protein YjgA (DUF615 family)
MRYHVDPDQLRKLAGGLLDVQTGLTRLGAGSTPGAALGAADLTAALDEVSRNWSHARRRLLSDLGHLTRATQAAAANYVAVDNGAALGCGPAQAHP